MVFPDIYHCSRCYDREGMQDGTDLWNEFNHPHVLDFLIDQYKEVSFEGLELEPQIYQSRVSNILGHNSLEALENTDLQTYDLVTFGLLVTCFGCFFIRLGCKMFSRRLARIILIHCKGSSKRAKVL